MPDAVPDEVLQGVLLLGGDRRAISQVAFVYANVVEGFRETLQQACDARACGGADLVDAVAQDGAEAEPVEEVPGGNFQFKGGEFGEVPAQDGREQAGFDEFDKPQEFTFDLGVGGLHACSFIMARNPGTGRGRVA